jgi:DNA-binding NtrC family response regulator
MRTLLFIGGSTGWISTLHAAVGPNVVIAAVDSIERIPDGPEAGRPDIVVVDVTAWGEDGPNAFREVRRRGAGAPVIVVADRGTSELAIELIRLGAYDYLCGPPDPARLRPLLTRALEMAGLTRDPGHAAPVHAPAGLFIGSSPAMQEVYKAIGRVADRDVTVLILGESGTGKELVAQAIYRHGCRSDGPFLPINCAAIPEGLLESELFGHEKGAFTGADRRRVGKFEQCRGGTLFLDEVGDMTPLTQAKILRVLQEQQFERVGGEASLRTDVRVIAATNRDLHGLATTGQFRSDLYYRLGVFTIHLPPLRERHGDLPLLVDHILGRFDRELGMGSRRVSPSALGLLQEYRWPGNVRELQSVLKQVTIQAKGPVIVPDDLPPAIRQPGPAPMPTGQDQEDGSRAGGDLGWHRFVEDLLRSGSRRVYAESVVFVERHLITLILRETGGNQVRAAQLLGITRGSLRNKIRALGIVIEPKVRAGGAIPPAMSTGGRRGVVANFFSPQMGGGVRTGP